MATRYTKKDADKCLVRLAHAMGGRVAKSFDDVGGLRIDYEPIYGGVNVEEISNKSGGISQPFGIMRWKPEAFCHAVRMAEDVVYHRKGKGLSGAALGGRVRRRRKARR
jgi:hypothetical protein